ncbi:unnamed protein product [Rotaria sordida]|uniref:VLIG-type G domain-containing protein n=1 Tax=Rotaria sordida TaxID=392033 RepID=A0A819QUC7_9BILA|nr:unnamed protein product [Rotaria sordida]CAF4029739.1 unnamed protein product [Rotaria sordida]
MAEFSDLSEIQSNSDEKLDNVAGDGVYMTDSDDVVKSITNKIIQVLQLYCNENKGQIVNSLLEKGRQSLVDYRGDIVAEVYTKEMDNKDSKLLELLKMYFQAKWETQYGSSNQWFSLFLKQYQNEENRGFYVRVLTRTAEYGNKYMKNFPILSIVLQLLFEAGDDTYLQETNIFDHLWFSITNNGLKSITKYSDYIIEDVMNEQINKKHSALFQALREYYRPQLLSLLEQSNIIYIQNLYELALNSVTEHGWLTGIQLIKNKTTPFSYEKLLKNIHSYQLQQQTQESKVEYINEHGIPIISMQSELSTNERSTIHNDDLETKEVHSTDINSEMNSECQSITTIYHDDKELNIIRSCNRAQSNLFQLEDLIQAGELQYMNQTLDDITKNLVDKFNYRKYTIPNFVQDCLTPIMYLLKRQQNLDDFFISLSYKYQEMEYSIEKINISLRMLLHILFTNSDIFLRRIIMSLLSKRNPVPFVLTSIQNRSQNEHYQFVPAIIHVWNHTRPTILSFGVGPCKGKSTLLNQLFQSTFEQTVDSIYFQQTIDIDFGYCFNPERTLNIADTHGIIDKQLLQKIQPLFDGFLIQIDKTFLNRQPQILIEYLNILPENKFQMIIIRDISVNNLPEYSFATQKLLRQYRGNFSQKLHIYPLINVSNTNDRNIGFAIKKIREELLTKIKLDVQITNNKDEVLSNLQNLMTRDYVEYLRRLNHIIKPLKNFLLQKNHPQSDKNCPLYMKFQELCKLRQKLKKIDFYGSESENMFGIYDKLHKLENELDPNTKTSLSVARGHVFDLFIDILKSDNMLMSLDLLSTELKHELSSLGGDKIAGDLTVENAFLSLEILWRNSIVCSEHTTNDKQNLIARSYYDFIAAGFPFEIIDGDNLHFQHKFLAKILSKFASKRILVISIIGPQNSGKSTLLNYMFGTLFDVREGRCTRGIYGSLVKLNKSNQNCNNSPYAFGAEISNVDYIMLVDTEGLLSIEKNDSEYDRRLVLFCLAVSHLVIINMMGDVNETLKDMLTLCADSLKQIGVNKVNQPIVHFVLNQKADPNLKNHTEAIERIIRDFKEKELAEVIDISLKTFHTLPSAFKKERVSNDAQSPCFLRTEPDFIQCAQQLCEKIIKSAKSSLGRSGETISDPPQWLQTAITIFDTLQKFPDLTYFKDINERRQDDRIRQHIGELISKTLSADYRKKTIIDLCELTENEIQRQFQAKFDIHQNDFDNDLKIIFKAANASERIRDRSRQFLKRQVTEISNAWCTAALQAYDQKQMEVLVRDGSDDLRKLIDDLIKSGQTMTKEKATEEFDTMWNKKLESINRSFDPQERLKQAIKFVYGNYNIFEKQCLPSHEHILHHLSFITQLSETSDMKLIIASVLKYFTQYVSRQRHSALESHWTPSTTNITYTLATIDNFSHLNKQILKNLHTASTLQHDTYIVQAMNHDEQNMGLRKRQKTRHSRFHILRKGVDVFTSALGFGPETTASTEQTTTMINIVPLQYDYIENVNCTIYHELEQSVNANSNILCLPTLFNKILQETIVIVEGNGTVRRPIEVDLTQKIVGLINTIINEINLELLVFKLTLSKQTKSNIHTFILILLTIYYYDEQKHHFQQQILTLNKEKPSLLTYFISMVVPDAQCDNEGAELFANKVKNAIQSGLMRDAQIIIARIIETQHNLNRKQVQIICDGKLHAAADDDDWLFRYIDAPTDIIIEEFQILWKEVEKTINQQLEKEKNQWKNILIEFFNRIEFMFSSLVNEGSSVHYIDDIFRASGGIAADNLTNKGQCMVLLLYAYLSGNKIQPGTSYTVFNENYTLNAKGLKLFDKLPSPSLQLASLINGMKDIDNSNNNRATVASIKNLHVFLQSIIDAEKTIEDTYDATPATFEAYDKDQIYNKLLDKVRGCTSKCPCCQRPCDVDHTLIKSNAGDEDNRHCCQTGHQLRAMAGVKFEISNEASLFQCEQMTDDRPIVVRGTKKKWSEFKNDYPDWDFGNSITPDELFKLRGKFLNVWSRIGELLCGKYGMEFVTENTPQATAKPFHYILLLDASGSMNGEPWRNLLDGVREFIKIRVDSNSSDHVTVIVFNDYATYACFNEDIKSVDITQIKYKGGNTNFEKAFDLVIETIRRTQSQSSAYNLFGHSEYIIIFMSDGQAQFPYIQMETLSTMNTMINQFWTVALGDTSMDVLKRINLKMDGTFKELKDSADFVYVYAEIARN